MKPFYILASSNPSQARIQTSAGVQALVQNNPGLLAVKGTPNAQQVLKSYEILPQTNLASRVPTNTSDKMPPLTASASIRRGSIQVPSRVQALMMSRPELLGNMGVPGSFQERKSYEILPPPGMASHGPKSGGCGCGGKCGPCGQGANSSARLFPWSPFPPFPPSPSLPPTSTTIPSLPPPGCDDWARDCSWLQYNYQNTLFAYRNLTRIAEGRLAQLRALQDQCRDAHPGGSGDPCWFLQEGANSLRPVINAMWNSYNATSDEEARATIRDEITSVEIERGDLQEAYALCGSALSIPPMIDRTTLDRACDLLSGDIRDQDNALNRIYIDYKTELAYFRSTWRSIRDDYPMCGPCHFTIL